MSLGAATAMKKNSDRSGKKHRKRNRKVVVQQAKYWMAMPALPDQTKLFWVGIAEGTHELTCFTLSQITYLHTNYRIYEDTIHIAYNQYHNKKYQKLNNSDLEKL